MKFTSASAVMPLLAIFASIISAPAYSQPFGIDTPRESNTDLLITELPDAAPGTMQAVRVFPQLEFTLPLMMAQAPGDPSRFFVMEKDGLIKVFPNTPDPAPGDVEVFLDLTDRVCNYAEQGLLGMAFDPDYATTGDLYVYFSYQPTGCTTENPSHRSRLARFHNDNPADNSISTSTQFILWDINQPSIIHNGGGLAFGPDEMLYWALGDGGGQDPDTRSQNTTTLFGKVLRIDVKSAPDPGKNYHIPTDNPFFNGGPAGASTRKEIFAYGLRNPYRMSFDSQNGFLLLGDVGASTWEEVNHIEAGNNYGWGTVEGPDCYPNPASGCDMSAMTPPLIALPHGPGPNSITMGYVYYGTEVPELYGRMLYTNINGELYAALYDGVNTPTPTHVCDLGFTAFGFGQGQDGEVYVLKWDWAEAPSGIYVIRPTVSGGGSTFPLHLSDLPALQLAGLGLGHTVPGVIPFEPSAKLWSDAAQKERYVAMPGLGQATYHPAGGWDFPEETVLIKNFSLPLDDRDPDNTLQRIETRLLYRKAGEWHGFSYEWNEGETDANLLTAAKERTFTRIGEDGVSYSYDWYYPSAADCRSCHTAGSNYVLGLNTPAMNFDFQYPSSGVTDNQLRTLDHIGFFDAALPDVHNNLPRMPDYTDTNEPLEDRARAYLASNCSMCHFTGSAVQSLMDLRWETALGATNTINHVPIAGHLGNPSALIITPGDPADSILYERLSRRDAFQMPPLATSTVDDDAAAMIADWIVSLGTADAEPAWAMYE